MIKPPDKDTDPPNEDIGFLSLSLSLYICCRVKHWSNFCPFLCQKLVQVSSFSFVFRFLKMSLSLQKKEGFANKNKKANLKR